MASSNLSDTTTRLVHCVARREGGYRKNSRVVFYLESGQQEGPPKPIFIAQKQKAGKFYIFNVPSESPEYVNHYFEKNSYLYAGKLARQSLSNGIFLSHSLFYGTKDKKKQVASVVYNTETLHNPVIDGFSDRVVYNILRSEDTNVENKQECHPIVAPSCPSASSESGKRYGDLHIVRSRSRSTTLNGAAIAREPFVVRFRGRGALSSQKNLQMVAPSTKNAAGSDGNDVVVFQMARWNKDEFTVDFQTPYYTPYQAFGIALAQLDI